MLVGNWWDKLSTPIFVGCLGRKDILQVKVELSKFQRSIFITNTPSGTTRKDWGALKSMRYLSINQNPGDLPLILPRSQNLSDTNSNTDPIGSPLILTHLLIGHPICLSTILNILLNLFGHYLQLVTPPYCPITDLNPFSSSFANCTIVVAILHYLSPSPLNLIKTDYPCSAYLPRPFIQS